MQARDEVPAVALAAEQRRLICQSMVGRLQRDGGEVVALAVCANHFHLLARFTPLTGDDRHRLRQVTLQDGRDPAPRHYLGLARKEASFTLSKRGLKPDSPVWAVRPKLDPVRDRGHQLNVAGYIRKHVSQGAAVFYLPEGFLFG